MTYPCSAARTNLTSNNASISNRKLGEGTFRVCYEGTYVGGNRNGQEAACKHFKPQFRSMEQEYFAYDFRIVDKAVEIADAWNHFCECGKEIFVNKGSIHHADSGILYLVEPFIRYYTKYTSNTGWIGDQEDWEVMYMEAYTHYSYHKSGGQLIVCDLQGRFKFNRFARSRSRFELTDPAICSRRRTYGPTDLGEKGIESFFANHRCNKFCQHEWAQPRNPRQWFPRTQGTSMLSSLMTNQLQLTSRATFRLGMGDILEEDSDESLSDYSDAY